MQEDLIAVLQSENKRLLLENNQLREAYLATSENKMSIGYHISSLSLKL